MEVRRNLDRLGFTFSVSAAAICAVLHIATFLTIVSFVWIIPAFLLVAAAVLCSNAVKPKRIFARPADRVAIFGFGLLLYSVFTFLYDYKTTAGATSVNIVDGHYVSMYKDHVIKAITHDEYRMFPNLWTRVMSAWIAMMAVFCSGSFRGVSADESRSR